MTEKMKISAIICELNPMHLGHEAIFKRAKEQTEGLICLMSGNFVQRGEPALLDKWARCRMALESGADLVFELPLPWACAGAERFAAGGVHMARALGCVTHLFFGSETPDTEALIRLAQGAMSEEFTRELERQGDSGETFAKRREKALCAVVGKEAELLSQPNAILAVEYIKAILQQGAKIEPVAVKRMGAGHDSREEEGFRSGSHIREMIVNAEDFLPHMPEKAVKIIKDEISAGRCPASLENIERAVLCKLRGLSIEELGELPDISEGLENRLYQGIRQAGSLIELYDLVKTKRYTHARVRRLIMAAFLGIKKDLPEAPPYLRLLGMSRRGEEILRSLKTEIPIAVRPGDFEELSKVEQEIFKLEGAADDIYAMACPTPQPCGRDYTEKLIKI